MTTVGYGDISPKSNFEKIFCIINTIFACGVFAFSINLIGRIVTEMYKDEDEFKFELIQFLKKIYEILE